MSPPAPHGHRVFGAHAELRGNEAKDVQGNGLPRRRKPTRISKGAKLEGEAQPVVSLAPHADMLDVVVGQRVMAQQGGFVRGQVEQGRALACAPDASSRHVPPPRYPFIPAGAALSVRGSVQRTAQSVAPPPAKQEPGASHMNGTGTIAEAGPYPYTSPMTATLIGYARCSTDRQDLAAQRQALQELGVAEDRNHTDHGLTGTTSARPVLNQALAAGAPRRHASRAETRPAGKVRPGCRRHRRPASGWRRETGPRTGALRPG